MGLQDVVSNTGHELMAEVDNMINPTTKDRFRGLFDSKAAKANKIKSLINKEKEERCFIQKYVETKRATFSNDITRLSFMFSMVVAIGALMIAIYSMNHTTYIQIDDKLYYIGLALILLAFIGYINELIRIWRGKNASEEIIIAIEDAKFWNCGEKSQGILKLDEIDNKTEIHQKNWWYGVLNMKMFDINNDEMRNRKLKFIEILLIVGGIIGAIRSGGIKPDVDLINAIFSLFILISIIYYGLVSHKIINPIMCISLGSIIAVSFAIIAVWPFTQLIIEEFALGAYILSIAVIALLTAVFIFLFLWIDEDKAE